jgi:DNA polymerase I-like protein with 3'-5' exonuclease and polymerase domains
MLSNLPCASSLIGWREWTPVLFIHQHDEIIIEARDGIEDQVEAIVKESMEDVFHRIIPGVPFVAEIRAAEAWDELQ